MMITPANGITPKLGDHSNERTEGIDHFSDSKDQLQMFISSKNSPKVLSQDTTPKKEKQVKQVTPEMSTAHK